MPSQVGDAVIDDDPLPGQPARPAVKTPATPLEPEDDDLLPEEIKRRQAAVKEQEKKLEVQVKEEKAAVIPVPEALRAIGKKYAGTPSAIRAEQLAREWEASHPAPGAKAPPQPVVMGVQVNQAPPMPSLEGPLLGPLNLPMPATPAQPAQPAQPGQPGQPGFQGLPGLPVPAPAPTPAQPKPNGDRVF